MFKYCATGHHHPNYIKSPARPNIGTLRVGWGGCLNFPKGCEEEGHPCRPGRSVCCFEDHWRKLRLGPLLVLRRGRQESDLVLPQTTHPSEWGCWESRARPGRKARRSAGSSDPAVFGLSTTRGRPRARAGTPRDRR